MSAARNGIWTREEPPHPGPPPQGEGEEGPAQGWNRARVSGRSPHPGPHSQGEGEEGALPHRKPSVWALAAAALDGGVPA